jgi:hypothetical protein
VVVHGIEIICKELLFLNYSFHPFIVFKFRKKFIGQLMSEEKLFSLENHTIKYEENNFFREILIYDQWSSDFFELIKLRV